MLQIYSRVFSHAIRFSNATLTNDRSSSFVSENGIMRYLGFLNFKKQSWNFYFELAQRVRFSDSLLISLC